MKCNNCGRSNDDLRSCQNEEYLCNDCAPEEEKNMTNDEEVKEPIAIAVYISGGGDLYSEKVYDTPSLDKIRLNEHDYIKDLKYIIVTGSNLKKEDYT